MENITTVETHETVKFAEVNDTRNDTRSATGEPVNVVQAEVDDFACPQAKIDNTADHGIRTKS